MILHVYFYIDHFLKTYTYNEFFENPMSTFQNQAIEKVVKLTDSVCACVRKAGA